VVRHHRTDQGQIPDLELLTSSPMNRVPKLEAILISSYSGWTWNVQSITRPISS
jgi:hypothetical protein